MHPINQSETTGSESESAGVGALIFVPVGIVVAVRVFTFRFQVLAPAATHHATRVLIGDEGGVLI